MVGVVSHVYLSPLQERHLLPFKLCHVSEAGEVLEHDGQQRLGALLRLVKTSHKSSAEFLLQSFCDLCCCNKSLLIFIWIVQAVNTNLMGSITVRLNSCTFVCLKLISNSFTCLVKSEPVKLEVRCTAYGDYSLFQGMLTINPTKKMLKFFRVLKCSY